MKTKREYTLKIIEDEKGIRLKRLNDGFNAFEILGTLELARKEILNLIQGKFQGKISEIKREVVVDEEE